MPRPAVLTLSSPRAWSLILAPVRFEMIEAMRMCAPCAIAQVAEILDRPADSLYRHMDKLVAAGVVKRVGVRRSGRRTEQVYDLVADDISPSFAGMTERQAGKVYAGVMATIAKIIARTARDAVRHGGLAGAQPKPHAAAFLEHSWLAPEDVPAFREHMKAFKAFLSDKRTPGRGTLYVVTAVAMPVVRKRGARQRSANASKSKRKAKATRASKPSSARKSARNSTRKSTRASRRTRR